MLGILDGSAPLPLPGLRPGGLPLASLSTKKEEAERGGERGALGRMGVSLAPLFHVCSHLGMAGRVGTVEDIAWRGHRLRLWCFGCARSRVLDEGKVLQLFADRGWDLDLSAAARRFPCRRCRSSRAVIVLPARPPAPPDPEPAPRELSWADEVAGFFHATRAARKQKPLPPAYAELLKKLPKQKGPGDRPGPSRKRIEDLD